MDRKIHTLETIAPHIKTSSHLIHQEMSSRTLSRRVSSGTLYQIRRGAYADPAFWESLKFHEQYLARIIAYNQISRNPVFSHQTAAVIQKLAVPFVPDVLHIYSRQKYGLTHDVRRHPGLDEVTALDFHALGIRTTSLDTTLRDCARTLPEREAVAIADSAIQRYRYSLEEVREILSDTTGNGCAKARNVAVLISGLAESPGESFTRILLIDCKLHFDEQVVFELEDRTYRADFKLRHYPVIIEFDGRIKYTDYGEPADVLLRERRREVELQNMGLYVFRTNWQEVALHPEIFKRKLFDLLANINRQRYG